MFVFYNPSTTEIYTYGHTLSLHDALPISTIAGSAAWRGAETERPMRTEKEKMLAGELYHASDAEIQAGQAAAHAWLARYNASLDQAPSARQDRTSTRLNSSH